MSDTLTLDSTGAGPLPSFTPPDHCTKSFQNVYRYEWTEQPSYILGPFTLTECSPEGYTDVDHADRAYFSPATACPPGFTPACTQVGTLGEEPETTITCCPFIHKETPLACNSLFRDSITRMRCHSIWTTPTTLASVTLLEYFAGNVAQVTEGSTLRDHRPDWPGHLFATGVEIQYQETDLPPGESQNETEDEPAAIRLGPGDIAGIVLGVVLGICLLAAILVWWRIMRRKRLARTAASETLNLPAELAQTEAHQAKRQGQPTWPVQDTGPAELPNSMGQHPGPPMHFELSVAPIPPTERVPAELHTMPAELK